MSMVNRKCKRCGDPFRARAADVKRGWALFCSKSCKAVYQEKRTHQHANYLQRQSFSRGDDNDFVGHPMEAGYFGHGQE